MKISYENVFKKGDKIKIVYSEELKLKQKPPIIPNNDNKNIKVVFGNFFAIVEHFIVLEFDTNDKIMVNKHNIIMAQVLNNARVHTTN